MLYIEDAAKVQITKVKPWAIYFNYEGEKYLLKEDSSFGSDSEDWTINLYKRIPINNKGFYLLECISSSWAEMPEIKYKKNRYRIKNDNSRPLKDIDVEFFILELTKRNLVRSYFSNYNSPIEKKKREIIKLQKEIEVLRAIAAFGNQVQ